MKRSIKAIGTCLAAILAVAAAVAPTASASFSSSLEHTFLTAEASSTQFVPFIPLGTGLQCQNISFNTNTSTALGQTVTQTTVGPLYEECEMPKPSSAKMYYEPTGCHFLFTDETDKDEKAMVHLVCQSDSEEIHLKVSALKLACVKIPGRSTANVGSGVNQSLTGVHYVNSESDIEIEVDIAGVTTTTQGSCQQEGEPSTHTESRFEGSIAASGKGTAGEEADLGYTEP